MSEAGETRVRMVELSTHWNKVRWEPSTLQDHATTRTPRHTHTYVRVVGRADGVRVFVPLRCRHAQVVVTTRARRRWVVGAKATARAHGAALRLHGGAAIEGKGGRRREEIDE